MSVDVEWDPTKAARNTRKHGVTFEEASTVFEDRRYITLIDDEHSDDEERYITIGLSHRGQLIVVAHTDRDNGVRIISARRAKKREERFYAQAGKH